MKKLNGLFGLFAVVSLAFASGCAGSARMVEIPEVEKPAAPPTVVDAACKDNGGSCVATGLGDLIGRAYNAVEAQVKDEENQATVKSAWEKTKDAASKGYDAAKEKIGEVTK